MTNTQKKHRVLLAEDDDEMRKLIKHALQHQGYEVTECSNGYELFARLLELIKAGQCLDHDLVISDIRMPGWTGLEVFEGVHEHEGCPPIILITAFGDKETHAKAQQLGVTAVFDKPFEIEDLLAKVHEIVALDTDAESENCPSLQGRIETLNFPLEIVYRHDVLHSTQNDRIIHKNAAKLNAFRDHIDACRVVVDMPHHHHHRGNLYHVEVILLVLGQELVADHDKQGCVEQKNIYVAVREAFEVIERRLKDYLDQHEKPLGTRMG